MTITSSIKQLLLSSTLLLGICILSLDVSAQQYFFQNYNTENGLVQSQSSCLAQDRFNRLWVGTWGGISVFDGTYFKNYTRLDGLISNAITAIDFLPDGSAWIGTSEGVSHFDGSRFTNHTLSVNPDSNWISALKVDNRNRVWVLSKNRLFQFAQGKFALQDQAQKDVAVSLFKDNGGVIHVAYLRSGIYKYENDKWQQVLAPFERHYLLAATFSKDGQITGLGTNGIFQLKNNELRYRSGKLGQIDFHSSNVKITVDQSDNVWLSSIKGVWLFKDKELQPLTFDNGFTNEQTLDLLTDNYDNIWLATNGSGLYKYAESPFSRFDQKMIPNAKSIISIIKRGDLLTLGSPLQGVYNFNIRSNTAGQGRYAGLPKMLTSIYQDDQAGLVVSYFNEAIQWKGEKKIELKAEEGPMNPASWRTIGDTLWGIGSKGLFKVERDRLILVHRANNFNELAPTKDGNILLSHSGGIAVFNRSSRSLDSIAALKGVRAQCMVADDERWYLGTDDRGLLIYNTRTRTFHNLDQRKGLSCNYVYNLLKDSNGDIWLGTGCGIDKISLHQDGSFHIKSYGKSDGLNGAESNVKASYADDEGMIWFGTTKGLFRYDGKKEKQIKMIPFVSLASLQLFSKDIEPGQVSDSTIPFLDLPYKPVFRHNENSLSFTFRAVCLSAPDKIVYKYQLIGVDKEFIETRSQIASYNQLGPGNYTFVVYASDEEGNWHENAFRYEFSIKAVFYQTWWFKLLIILISAGGTAYFIYRYSQRKAEQRQRELKLREEEQNKVRQRTAEDFHDEVGNKITRINLLTMMAEKKAKDDETLRSLLQQVRQNTQSLYYGTKDIIWALQKESNYLKEALLRIQQNSIGLLNETGIQLQIEDEPPIVNDILMPMDHGRNLILIFKEAVNNAMKYSGASRLTLRFYEDIDNSIVLELEDNGHGFDVDEQSKGNGLKNMRNRAKAIKANFSVHSLVGIGTLVRLRMFSYSFEQ